MGWLFPARQSENAIDRPRSLLLPQEVTRLPPDEMIVLRPTLQPLKLARIYWYSDPAFQKMGGPLPEVPRLHLRVERDPIPSGLGSPPVPHQDTASAENPPSNLQQEPVL
jgi:type IV secretory pathway TraG/TraD family ATPase VirD4